MTAPTEDLIANLEALLAGEPVFVVGHPVSRAITALRALQQEVEFAVALVKELSDELASEVEGRYESLLPQLQHRFDRDMTTVEDARSFLAARSALTGSAQG